MIKNNWEKCFSVFDWNAPHFKTIFYSFTSKLFKQCIKELIAAHFFIVFHKESCYPKRVSLTKEDIAQDMPNREIRVVIKTSSWKKRGCDQWILPCFDKENICLPPSLLKLIQSQYFSLTCLLSKETHFRWNPWIPNNTHWERNQSPKIEDKVTNFDRKGSTL